MEQLSSDYHFQKFPSTPTGLKTLLQIQRFTRVELKLEVIGKMSWDVKKQDEDFLYVSLKLIQILLFMPDSASQLHMTRWKTREKPNPVINVLQILLCNYSIVT